MGPADQGRRVEGGLMYVHHATVRLTALISFDFLISGASTGDADWEQFFVAVRDDHAASFSFSASVFGSRSIT